VPALEDPEAAAEAAGLRYVHPDEQGLARRRCGKGFTYLSSGSKTVRSTRQRARIDALAIPPAWTEVWICADDIGHVQATGRDARSRKQYRYHDTWAEVRAADKFEQLAPFGDALTPIRKQVATDLGGRGLSRRRVTALAVRLLDETLVRVGNPGYARDESFGLTTLESRHVSVDGNDLVFEFSGKSGIEQQVEVTDPSLVRAVRACDDLGGRQLFTYRDEGEIHALCSDDVNEYLRDIAGPSISAKDFRTWGGTVAVVENLGPVEPSDLADDGAVSSRLLEAIDEAADRLGNTRSVCRGSYVHPIVDDAFPSGDLHRAWRGSRRTKRLTRAERATLRLLQA